MDEGKQRILNVVSTFTGRDGEPTGDVENYILKSMWLMMLSEFEASIKTKVESYIDQIKKKDISDIHVCLLTRHFFGNKNEELTLKKIISFYKKNPNDISYRHFTQDRVPKYKFDAIQNLFNNLGIFFNEDDVSILKELDSIASTRDSIAHGDTNVQITKNELENKLHSLQKIIKLLNDKLNESGCKN